MEVLRRRAVRPLYIFALWAASIPPASAPPVSVPFQACFSQAWPVPDRPVVDIYGGDGLPTWDAQRSPAITVVQDATGKIEQDPGPLSESIARHVGGAVVKLTAQEADKEIAASGVLVRVDATETVVLTAQHMATSHRVAEIEVTSPADPSVHSGVASGCYVSLNDQQELSAEEKAAYARLALPIDLAVLRLQRPLGADALTLASAPPRRGEWLAFCNFQANRSVARPLLYNGLALNMKSPIMANMVLTGLQPEPIPFRESMSVKEMQKLQSGLAPGGSGGAVVERSKGQLVGLSVSMVGVAPGLLPVATGVSIANIHPQTLPRVAGMVDVAYLRQAIASGKWRANTPS